MTNPTLFLSTLLCLFLPLTVVAQGWSPLNSGTTQTLNSVYFTDENTGWVVGDGGTIRKTTDGGANWLPQSSFIGLALRSVHFINASIGWTVGDGGIILRSTNGGINWNPQNSGTTYPLYSVHFVNANVGWAVGGSVNMPTILKTINGGMQWTGYSVTAGLPLHSVYFLNTNTGWTVGANRQQTMPTPVPYARTIDGGATWIFNPNLGVNAYSIRFFNGNIGWCAGDLGEIWKSIDGGQNWAIQKSVQNSDIANLYSISFMNIDTGYAVGGGGAIPPPPNICPPVCTPPPTAMYRTNNGGVNWVSQNSGTAQALYSVFFPSQNVGYTSGANGTILKFNTPVNVRSMSTQNVRFWFSGNGEARYKLNIPSRVRVLLLDANGKVSIKVLDEFQNVGQHTLQLPKKLLGPYFLDLQSDEFHKTLKLLE